MDNALIMEGNRACVKNQFVRNKYRFFLWKPICFVDNPVYREGQLAAINDIESPDNGPSISEIGQARRGLLSSRHPRRKEV